MDEKVALRDLDLSMHVMGIRDHDDGKPSAGCGERAERFRKRMSSP